MLIQLQIYKKKFFYYYFFQKIFFLQKIQNLKNEGSVCGGMCEGGGWLTLINICLRKFTTPVLFAF